MTDISDPGTISNGDTPDWDLVQAYFNAIYAVINNPGQLENNNIKAGAGIDYSKLDLFNSIVGTDLTTNAVDQNHIKRTTANYLDTSSAVSSVTPSTWTNTGAQIAALQSGLYVLSYAGSMKCTFAGGLIMQNFAMSLLIGGSRSVIQYDKRTVGSTEGTVYIPFSYSGIHALTGAPIDVYLQMFSSFVEDAGCDLAGLEVRATRISN